MILGAHSKIGSLGEIMMLPLELDLNGKCSCGETVHNCAVWKKVSEEFSTITNTDIHNHPEQLFLGHIHTAVHRPRFMGRKYKAQRFLLSALKFGSLRYGLPIPKGIFTSNQLGINNSIKIFELARKHMNKSIVVDSSKLYLRAIDLYQALGSELKTILLVRDGRAVFNSFMKHGFSKEAALNAWKNHYARAMPLLDKYIPASNMLVVRYEDLVLNAQDELNKICKWADIEFDEQMLNFSEAPHHNINGNDIRFIKTSKLILDEKWRKNLSKEDIDYFNEHGGALNQSFGYSAN
jgi:hypothetical protein